MSAWEETENVQMGFDKVVCYVEGVESICLYNVTFLKIEKKYKIVQRLNERKHLCIYDSE